METINFSSFKKMDHDKRDSRLKTEAMDNVYKLLDAQGKSGITGRVRMIARDIRDNVSDFFAPKR